MTHFKTMSGTTALALVLAAPAAADVSAADVWSEWQDMLSIYGESGLSIGGESQSGNTLTVSDITLSMSDENASVNADLGDLVLEELGDGTVRITMAESYPITMEPEPGGMLNMTVTQSGMEMIASGDPGNISYALTADRYGIAIDEITENGASVMDGDIRFEGQNITGNYTVASNGDMRNITYSLAMGALDMLVDATDTQTGEAFLFSGKFNAMTAAADITMPMDMNMQNPETLFADGFAVNGGYGYDNGAYLFEINADGDQINGTVSTGAGQVSVEMDQGMVAYDVGVADIAFQMTSDQAPFPINVNLGEYGVGFGIPMQRTEEPTDMSFRLNMTDLSVNDELWMMADPMGALPRDPITLKLDLTGAVKLFFDILDPEQAEAMAMADVPGELHSVTLNELVVRGAGAEVTGSGAFTFDNSDMVTFNGLPRPEGEVTVDIEGANALIDNLVQMGLLPEDQAMMSRMMMGMFARTVGEDQLTSTIEVNDQGHVIANGQRIQ